MINRFIADLNSAQQTQTMSPISYNSECIAVLDLSRRRDSVETRKTPSPYNTNSSRESASPGTSLERPTINLASNSPKSLSNYSAVSYSNATAFSMDTSATLQNQRLQYCYPTLLQADRNSLHQHSTFKPAPVHQNPAHVQVKEEYTRHDPSNASENYQHPNVSRKSPPVLPSSAELNLGANVQRSVSNNHDEITRSPSAFPSLFYPKLLSRDRKIARPFKAYPRDPLAMAATFSATDALLDTQKAEKYNAFRKRMLQQIHASNGGRATVSNPKMRRTGHSNAAYQEEQANDSSSGNEDQLSSGADSCHNPADRKDPSNNNNSLTINQNGVLKDAAYYERRKKNNAAAKKSRDRRRIKEDEIAVRAAFLEHENIELRIELAALKNQLAMLTANSSR